MTVRPIHFDFSPTTRIVFGAGGIDRLGELVREHGGSRVLLVTDPGLVAAGHAEHVRRVLEASKIRVSIFDKVRENPTTRDVDACLEVAKSNPVDFIVALGGGSAMDCAKGCNFLLTNGGRMQDYWGVGKATKPMLPLIAVPTTTGTGSELQSFALIADEETHQKMACGDRKAAAKVALLDPALATSQPRDVIAYSGLDAITHAVETAVTKKRNPISLLFSREAFRRAERSFPKILANPSDLDAMGDMLLAACYAGLAIENSMLGAAHSMANPLTARFGITHGRAVGMMLPHVIEFNRKDSDAAKDYIALVRQSSLEPSLPIDVLVNCIGELLELAGIERTLSDCGVTHDAIPALAEEAAKQWTARFNPRPASVADFERMYRAAME